MKETNFIAKTYYHFYKTTEHCGMSSPCKAIWHVQWCGKPMYSKWEEFWYHTKLGWFIYVIGGAFVLTIGIIFLLGVLVSLII